MASFALKSGDENFFRAALALCGEVCNAGRGEKRNVCNAYKDMCWNGRECVEMLYASVYAVVLPLGEVRVVQGMGVGKGESFDGSFYGEVFKSCDYHTRGVGQGFGVGVEAVRNVLGNLVHTGVGEKMGYFEVMLVFFRVWLFAV